MNIVWSEPCLLTCEFVVVERAVVPGEDKYKMLLMRNGEVIKDYGTHPSAKGARKFFNHRVRGCGE